MSTGWINLGSPGKEGMVQPLCSALHDLCRHLEPPPTSDQGLEGTLGVTGGLEDTGTVQDWGNVEW